MSRRVEPLSQIAAGVVSMLHRACFPEDPWDVGAIEQIMSIPGFFGRLGWEKEEPVGFALALDLGKEAELLSLGVVRGHQRGGIGSALLHSVCCEARMRGAECIALEVAIDNDAARSLYAANGFIVVDRRRNYYRQAGQLVDALILRRALATALPAI
jgi:[ribosomal protein S18]-alanine N-acetyltransferase